MIKNHTHNNDSGSIHYIFKKILDLGIIKEAFTIILLFSKSYPAGTIRWIKVEMKFRTTSRRYFNYISTLFQCQMPAGYAFPYKLCNVLVYDIVIFYFLFDPFKI